MTIQGAKHERQGRKRAKGPTRCQPQRKAAKKQCQGTYSEGGDEGDANEEDEDYVSDDETDAGDTEPQSKERRATLNEEDGRSRAFCIQTRCEHVLTPPPHPAPREMPTQLKASFMAKRSRGDGQTMAKVVAILDARLRFDEINGKSISDEEKRVLKRDVLDEFADDGVDLWPTRGALEIGRGTLLKQALETGIRFTSTQPVARDGNGFCVMRTKIGALCDVLGIKYTVMDSSATGLPGRGTAFSTFKYMMKECGLDVFEGDPDRVYFYHSFIRPGDEGKDLAKRLTIGSGWGEDAYAVIPLDIVEDKEADAKCEFRLSDVRCRSRSQLLILFFGQ